TGRWCQRAANSRPHLSSELGSRSVITFDRKDGVPGEAESRSDLIAVRLGMLSNELAVLDEVRAVLLRQLRAPVVLAPRQLQRVLDARLDEGADRAGRRTVTRQRGQERKLRLRQKVVDVIWPRREVPRQLPDERRVAFEEEPARLVVGGGFSECAKN